MSSLQIPPEFDEPIPVPPQTSLPTRCHDNDSDNYFKTCPQMSKTRKGKKSCLSSTTQKEKIRTVGPVPLQKQINVAPKSPAKRTIQRRTSVLPPTRLPQASKKSLARRPTARQTRNMVADKLLSSTSADDGIFGDEFEKFKTSVSIKFYIYIILFIH